jgi:molecular chaperone GrpE (heat shock protein)
MQAMTAGKTATEVARMNIELMNLPPALREIAIASVEMMEAFNAGQAALQNKATWQSQLDSTTQGLLTEEELIKQSYERRLEAIAMAEALGLQTQLDTQELKKRAQEKFNEDMKKYHDEHTMTAWKTASGVVDALGAQFQGVKAVNKKMFAMMKAYKIAKAITNTYDAANEALASPYPWPIPQVLAATAVAAGLANVAQIKAQSFEGGGFTGNGARAGGMDGKGGFMAMLHPNESVVDHSKGQGQGITIINNIDASGGGADVDMKIREAMIETSQHTIATIQDLMRRKRFA